VSPMKAAPPPTKPMHHPLPKPKKKRKSITAAQSARANAKRLAEHKQKVHKRATIFYEQQLKKPPDDLKIMSSASSVATVAK